MIACPRCHTIQPVSSINTGELHTCPGCKDKIRADVFNAFARHEDPRAAAGNHSADGLAECFYHSGKQAMAACDSCGRLLCALCRVEFNDGSICMRCLQSGREKHKISVLQNQRVLNDSIALHLACWPILMIFPTLLTAPAAIFFAIRHWRTPAGVLPRAVFKSILALLLAAGQLAAWVVFFVFQFG